MNGPTGTRVPLAVEECLMLLRTKRIGRIAYTDRALPAIGLVSYGIVNGTVQLRSVEALSVALRDAVIAFQADDLDSASGEGWSVTCVGKAVIVPGLTDVLVLDPTLVSGWRASPPVAPAISPEAARAS